jgi:hypothetical protein
MRSSSSSSSSIRPMPSRSRARRSTCPRCSVRRSWFRAIPNSQSTAEPRSGSKRASPSSAGERLGRQVGASPVTRSSIIHERFHRAVNPVTSGQCERPRCSAAATAAAHCSRSAGAERELGADRTPQLMRSSASPRSPSTAPHLAAHAGHAAPVQVGNALQQSLLMTVERGCSQPDQLEHAVDGAPVELRRFGAIPRFDGSLEPCLRSGVRRGSASCTHTDLVTSCRSR